MTHTTTFERLGVDDEPAIEIEVEFTLSGGHDGSAPSLTDPGEPGEPPELEIIATSILATGEVTTLTDAEEEKVRDDVYQRLDDYLDDGSYPDDHYDPVY